MNQALGYTANYYDTNHRATHSESQLCRPNPVKSCFERNANLRGLPPMAISLCRLEPPPARQGTPCDSNVHPCLQLACRDYSPFLKEIRKVRDRSISTIGAVIHIRSVCKAGIICAGLHLEGLPHTAADDAPQHVAQVIARLP